jgi:hypothetical protein
MQRIGQELHKAGVGSIDSFDPKSESGYAQKLVDRIEMMEEETAAGFKPHPTGVTDGMRYLHSSRTIHQLITDRNKAVGIFLAVASLLLTACGIVLNARDSLDTIVPIREIQRWCLPVTFGVLTVLALFMALLLIRTRVGLIYEVAKMNALLGLPVGRVQNLNPLSIFFILQCLISAGGGFSAGMFTIFLSHALGLTGAGAVVAGSFVGGVVVVLLIVTYILTIKAILRRDKFKAGG